MWIPGDILVSPRKLTTALAKEAQANGLLFAVLLFNAQLHIFDAFLM